MRLALVPYRLPLRAPWSSARGVLTARTGWLVVAHDEGIAGYGDCAPLPEAGTETAARAQTQLHAWRRQAARLTPDALLARLTAAWPSATPCADGAVETALLDRRARAAGVPLWRELTDTAAARIPVNAALGALDETSVARLAAGRAAGYRVFKFKLGLTPPALALRHLATLLEALAADERLRCDVNGAWDEPAARAFLDGLLTLDPARIELIEEPLRAPDDAALARLQARTPVPLALDETLAHRPRPLDPGALPVRCLVLKPAVLGGLRPTWALACAARAAGRQVVVTSLVESAAGLWATTQVAAAIVAATPAAQVLAHGLATADWLAHDLGPAPPPQNGALVLPACPGSGFVLSGWRAEGADMGAPR